MYLGKAVRSVLSLNLDVNIKRLQKYIEDFY